MSRFDRALQMRDLLISLATNDESSWDQQRYLEIRKELMRDPIAAALLPEFVRSSYDWGSLWSYFKRVATGTGAYGLRRGHIYEQFSPLLGALEGVTLPSDLSVTNVLTSYDAGGVMAAWTKCMERRDHDPEGAITSARTLLEETCKHILDDAAGGVYSEKDDLPKLYGKVSVLLGLAPSQHTEQIFKEILGSAHKVVVDLGRIRNKDGDAHAGGRKRVKPSARHAALAVNLAGAISMFLIETKMLGKI